MEFSKNNHGSRYGRRARLAACSQSPLGTPCRRSAPPRGSDLAGWRVSQPTAGRSLDSVV